MKFLASFCLLALFSVAAFAQPTGYQVGDQAADFSLKGTDGKMHSLATLAGENGTVVVFTCNTCPYSVAYEDRLIELQTAASAMGYEVVAINPNDPAVRPADGFAEMQVRAKEKSFNFPYLFDDGQQVYPAWGATRTPHLFVLDANRTVQYIGALDNNTDASKADTPYVLNAIAALAAGKKPDPAKTKAIGCTIKTKA